MLFLKILAFAPETASIRLFSSSRRAEVSAPDCDECYTDWSVCSFSVRSLYAPSRRDELIDAAMRVFYRCGFHASSLDDIQKEGGISRMTLYNHFKSKDELILAAMRRRDEIFRNRLMKFVESASKEPRERIAAVFDFHEQWFSGEEFLRMHVHQRGGGVLRCGLLRAGWHRSTSRRSFGTREPVRRGESD